MQQFIIIMRNHILGRELLLLIIQKALGRGMVPNLLYRRWTGRIVFIREWKVLVSIVEVAAYDTPFTDGFESIGPAGDETVVLVRGLDFVGYGITVLRAGYPVYHL